MSELRIRVGAHIASGGAVGRAAWRQHSATNDNRSGYPGAREPELGATSARRHACRRHGERTFAAETTSECLRQVRTGILEVGNAPARLRMTRVRQYVTFRRLSRWQRWRKTRPQAAARRASGSGLIPRPRRLRLTPVRSAGGSGGRCCLRGRPGISRSSTGCRRLCLRRRGWR